MFGLLPAPTPGNAAPTFSLPDQNDRRVSLLDFRGVARVVLAFYVEDETPG